MSQRKPVWLVRAAVPAAVLTLALTGCNSDEDSEDTGSDSNASQTQEPTPDGEQQEQPTEEPSAEDTAEEEPAAGGSDVEAVAAGSYDYQLGETSDPVPFEEGDATAVLEITADRVEVGKHADLDGILSDPSQGEGMVPAHIYTTISNVGGQTLEFTHPGGDANTVNADGSYGTPLILIGTEIPGGCSDAQGDSVDIAVGDTVEQCTTVLIPEATEPSQVYWAMVGGEHELMWAVG